MRIETTGVRRKYESEIFAFDGAATLLARLQFDLGARPQL